MADISIDVTAEGDAVTIDNPQGFDLRLAIGGLSMEMTHDQARALHAQLQGFFGPERGEQDAFDAARWRNFASSPQTALMLGSLLNPNDPGVDWKAECDRLADAGPVPREGVHGWTELTDEQLFALRTAHCEQYGQYCDNSDFVMVARAILAKARAGRVGA